MTSQICGNNLDQEVTFGDADAESGLVLIVLN